MSKPFPAFLVLVALATFSPARSEATPIIYTQTATGSGSLGSTSFNNALITIVGTGDTGNVANLSSGVFTNPVTTTVTITGVGSATFTDSVRAVSNQGTLLAGFGDFTNNTFILGTNNSAVSSYNLTTAFGPITGVAAFNFSAGFATTAGTFSMTAATNSSFQAVLSSSNAVPEPATLSLCVAAGLIGLAARTVRRRPALDRVA